MASTVNPDANARRLAFIESCFGVSGQPLAVPGRVLVGEGILTKACRKRDKQRQFFLFNDIIVYGNILIPKRKYNKQHIIPLEEVKIEILRDIEGTNQKNGWLMCTRGRSFAVYAGTPLERQEWIHHIEKCIKDLLKAHGKQRATDHAAVWLPDNATTVCLVCKNKFGALNRRHHCRKCGTVVCGNCSTHKFLMPSQSSKPLRVCDPCYKTLVQFPESNAPTQAKGSEGGREPGTGEENNQDSSGEEAESDDEEQPETKREDGDCSPKGWEPAATDGKQDFIEVAEEGQVSIVSQVGPEPRSSRSPSNE